MVHFADYFQDVMLSLPAFLRGEISRGMVASCFSRELSVEECARTLEIEAYNTYSRDEIYYDE